MFAQTTGNNRIPWGNTNDKVWEINQHQVTFHFSSNEYRKSFIHEAKRLLPESWSMVSTKDNDPPNPK
jgi:hypothetical protein